MPVILPSEQGFVPLSLSAWEAIIRVSFRAFDPITINADTLTIPGSGRYKLLPQTGVTDQITSIVLTGENLEGTSIMLRTATVGHTITLVNNANLHLLFGNNVELNTIYSTMKLWHAGSGIWAMDGPVSFCP